MKRDFVVISNKNNNLGNLTEGGLSSLKNVLDVLHYYSQ